MFFRILRALVLIFVLGFLLLLFRPQLVASAGQALLTFGNDASASGSASVTAQDANTGKGADFQINMQALAANFHYTVTLDEGKCGGKVLAVVKNVTSDQNGNVDAEAALTNFNTAVKDGIWVD